VTFRRTRVGLEKKAEKYRILIPYQDCRVFCECLKLLEIPGFFDVFVFLKIAEIPAKNIAFGCTKVSSSKN